MYWLSKLSEIKINLFILKCYFIDITNIFIKLTNEELYIYIYIYIYININLSRICHNYIIGY